MFFVGDSAGPLPPALGRGHPPRVLLRHRRRAGDPPARSPESRRPSSAARLPRVLAPSPPAFTLALALQRAIPRLPPRALTGGLGVMGRERPCRRAFDWYLTVAPTQSSQSPNGPRSGEGWANVRLGLPHRPGFDALTGLPDRAALLAALRRPWPPRGGPRRRALPRPRRLQARQRRLRARGRRPAADPGRRSAAARCATATSSPASAATSSPSCSPDRRAARGDDRRRPHPRRCPRRSTSPASAATSAEHRHRLAPRRRGRPDALLRDADTAMYQAKGAGKDRVEVFSDETPRGCCAGSSSSSACAARSSTTSERALPAAGRPRAGRMVGARRSLAGRGAARRGVHPGRRGDRADRPARRVVLRTATRRWPTGTPTASSR